ATPTATACSPGSASSRCSATSRITTTRCTQPCSRNRCCSSAPAWRSSRRASRCTAGGRNERRRTVRKVIAVLAGLVVLGAANWTIQSRERLLADGRVVLLELAPVDPRSLIQGDYMALRFKAADDAFGGARQESAADGRLVV